MWPIKQKNFFDIFNPKKDPINLKIWVDGASRGNPGPSGVGIVIKSSNGKSFEKGFFLGDKATNNLAEYFALVCALDVIKNHKYLGLASELEIFSDSQLMVNQLKEVYKVKDLRLKFLKQEILNQLSAYSWKASHIPREQNTIADKMSNLGIDTKTNLPPKLQNLFNKTLGIEV